MAELKEAFPVIADSVSGAGESLISRIEGEAGAGMEGLIGFSFKDSSGNVVLPQLDTEGRILVNMEGAGTELAGEGALAAGSATMVNITNADITLTADAIYSKLSMSVSCFREALFHLVQVDDATSTILAKVRVGPGQYSFEWYGYNKKFTAGSTGTQTLKVMGQNIDKLSEMSAELSCVELVSP